MNKYECQTCGKTFTATETEATQAQAQHRRDNKGEHANTVMYPPIKIS